MMTSHKRINITMKGGERERQGRRDMYVCCTSGLNMHYILFLFILGFLFIHCLNARHLFIIY